MLNREQISKKSVVFTWTISYAVFLILSLLINGILYYRIEKVLKSEISRSNDIFLNQLCQYTDSLANDARMLGIDIALSPVAKDIMEIKGNIGKKDLNNISKCIQELRDYKISNSSIDKIYIYFKNIDKVVNDRTMVDSKVFYDSYMKSGNMSYKEWMEMMNIFYTKGYYISNLSQKSHKGSIIRNISYTRSLPLSRPDKNLATAVVSINESQFLKMVEEIELTYKGKVMILDSDNRVVWSTANLEKMPNTIDFSKMDSEKGLFFTGVDGEEVVASYTTSKTENWKYVLMVPGNIFWEKLQYTRKLLYCTTILFMIIGGITAIILIKRNYRPVSRLVNTIENYINRDEAKKSKESNEYNYIDKALNKIVEEKERINVRLIHQNEALKDRFLEKLLLGRIDKSNIIESLKVYDFNFVSQLFGIILFSYNDNEENINNQNVQNYNMIRNVFQVDQSEILKGLPVDSYKIFIVEIEDMLAFIINIKEDYIEQGNSNMRILAKRVRNYFEDNYEISISAAISSMHESIEELKTAYNEALQVKEYEMVTGKNQVFNYDELSKDISFEYYFPSDKELQLINSIKAGDFSNVKNIIEELYYKNFEDRVLSPYMARFFMFSLIDSILKSIKEIQHVNGEKYSREIMLMEQLINIKSIIKVKENILIILEEFCNSIVLQKKSGKADIKEKVEQYVLENYANENLGLPMIADFFQMHPVYISKLYKLQTGEGIPDFINKVRVKNAIEIMKKQKMSIEDISRTVGYSNARTFTRIFSKIQGITPGKYKDMIIEN